MMWGMVFFSSLGIKISAENRLTGGKTLLPTQGIEPVAVVWLNGNDTSVDLGFYFKNMNMHFTNFSGE